MKRFFVLGTLSQPPSFDDHPILAQRKTFDFPDHFPQAEQMKQQLRRPGQFPDQFGEVSQLTQVNMRIWVLFLSRDGANRPYRGTQLNLLPFFARFFARTRACLFSFSLICLCWR